MPARSLSSSVARWGSVPGPGVDHVCEPLVHVPRLQPGRGVDDVAGDHRLSERGPRAEIDERLAGVDRDPQLKVRSRNGVADRDRCTHRALRVVAERGRRAEDRHHRVADELLDDTAEGLELVANGLVIGREHRPHIFWIEALAEGGRAHEVDEYDADDASLLPECRLRRRERGRTRETETGDVGIFLGASRANQHRISVRRPPGHGKPLRRA